MLYSYNIEAKKPKLPKSSKNSSRNIYQTNIKKKLIELLFRE